MQTAYLSSLTPNQSQKQYKIGIIDHKPTVLTRIYDDNISVCIQTRNLSKAITDYATFICESHSNIELSLIVTTTSVAEQLNKSLPYHDFQSVFIQDICTIVDIFSCLFDQEKIGLRLIVLTKAMCPRFHTDRILCRLITTYLGKGTEWLDSNHIDPIELATYNEMYCNQPYLGKIPCFHLQSGDIALFKGDRWEKSIGNYGVIHRSPQLDKGEVRLLLTLDMIS